jgi:hypothetical protein
MNCLAFIFQLTGGGYVELLKQSGVVVVKQWKTTEFCML